MDNIKCFFLKPKNLTRFSPVFKKYYLIKCVIRLNPNKMYENCSWKSWVIPCRESTHGTDSDDISGNAPPDAIKHGGERGVPVQQVVRAHEGDDDRDAGVGDEACEQRDDDTDRDCLLWVLHFLPCISVLLFPVLMYIKYFTKTKLHVISYCQC